MVFLVAGHDTAGSSYQVIESFRGNLPVRQSMYHSLQFQGVMAFKVTRMTASQLVMTSRVQNSA
jgi:hypothetical protein